MSHRHERALEDATQHRDFLEWAHGRSERQLEKDLDWLKNGEEIDASPESQKRRSDFIRWYEALLEERRPYRNTLEIREGGIIATRGEHERAEERARVQGGLDALRANIASAIAFVVTKNPQVAAIAGGFLSFLGAAATGRNEFRQIGPGGSAQINPPDDGGSKPQSESPVNAAVDGPVVDDSPESGVARVGSWFPGTMGELIAHAKEVFGLSEETEAPAEELRQVETPSPKSTLSFTESLEMITDPARVPLEADATREGAEEPLAPEEAETERSFDPDTSEAAPNETSGSEWGDPEEAIEYEADSVSPEAIPAEGSMYASDGEDGQNVEGESEQDGDAVVVDR